MPRKPRVRTLMDSQHDNRSETLPKSAWQFFSRIFWSVWKEISLKNLILVVSETLRLFVNILTPDEKCSLSVNASGLRNQFQCNYLEIEKYFLRSFLHFRNLNKIFKNFAKKAEPQRLYVSEIIDFKERGYLNA